MSSNWESPIGGDSSSPIGRCTGDGDSGASPLAYSHGKILELLTLAFGHPNSESNIARPRSSCRTNSSNDKRNSNAQNSCETIFGRRLVSPIVTAP